MKESGYTKPKKKIFILLAELLLVFCVSIGGFLVYRQANKNTNAFTEEILSYDNGDYTIIIDGALMYGLPDNVKHNIKDYYYGIYEEEKIIVVQHK